MSRRRVVATAAGLALVASGCGGSATSTGGSTSAPKSFPTSHTLSLSFLQDPGQPPDPDVYYAGQGLLLTRNLYEGLLQYQPGTAARKIVPSLATSYTVSPDGLTYTFQLRQGVTFHDGTPFTSAAVAASFARRAAVNGGPAYMVQGATVSAPGPYTSVIKLASANSAFLDFLASAYGPVMESPTALAANAGSDHDQTYLQTHDVGTGPYTLSQSKVGVGYQLQAYPGYWGAKPYYTTVDMPVITDLSTEEVQFNSGQLAGILHDLTTTAALQYSKSSSVRFYNLPVLESEEMYVNQYRGFLTSTGARVALQQAINVPAIVAAVFPGGRATVPSSVGPLHLLPAGAAPQKLVYDPSKLKKIVSGLAPGDRTITLGYDTSASDDQLIAEQVGAQLQADGLTAKVVGYQTSSIYGWIGSTTAAKSTNQTPDVLFDYFWPDADNPYTWSHITFDSTGGLNYLTCTVPGVDDLDTQVLGTGDTATYTTIAEKAYSSGCWLNLASKNDTMVFQPWMQGVAAAHVIGAPQSLLLSKLYPA